MTDVSLPPVPQKLRETLIDYPEHIERLQVALNSAVEKSSKASSPFEFAIWMLKGKLGDFVDEARDELEAAQAINDSVAAEKAKIKKFIFGAARADMGVLSYLETYFDEQ